MIPSPGRPRQLAALYRVMARLVSSGIPPLQCASVLEQSPQGAWAQPAADALAKVMASGGLPSQALAQARHVPPAHASVMAAAESTGRLDAAFDLLAASCEEQARVQALAMRLAIEPVIAWLIIALLLPLGTLIASGAGAYAARALPILAAPLLLGIVLRRSALRHARLPGFTEVLRLLATARACRTLALLNGAGVPLPRSLREAGEAAAHPVLSPAMRRAAIQVERGTTLAQALKQAAVLRPVEMALVADGEITGRIDVSFLRAAELLEHEGFAKARTRIRVVAVILFAIVAAHAALSLATAVTPTMPAMS